MSNFKYAISVLGTKGGVGKTTISHMLSLGMSSFGISTILFVTDTNTNERKNLNDSNRSYSTRSAQSNEDLVKSLKRIKSLDTSERNIVAIFDGGGNRQNVDLEFAKFSDVVILPTKESEEDYRVLKGNIKRIPDALILPNEINTNFFARSKVNEFIKKIKSENPNSVVLDPLPSIRGTKQLLVENFTTVNRDVCNASRKLAADVLERLGVEAYKLKEMSKT